MRGAFLAMCFLLPVATTLAADPILPGVGSRYRETRLERPLGVPDDAQLLAADARIGAIKIDPRAIFDTQIPEDDTAVFRLANRLHIRTRTGTIEEQLLFRSGDRYDPQLVAESERLLRDTRYLREATIRPVAWHDGVVDIEVTTQDVWTLNPGISFGRQGGQNTSGIEIEELNLLGLGTQLGLGFKSGVDRDSTTAYYRDRHLGRSWWSLGLQHSDNSDGKTSELALEHPFYALDTRWAAGGTFRHDQRVDSLYDGGAIIDRFATDERQASLYGGWSPGLQNGWARRWSLGATLDEHRFSSVTLPAPTTFVPPDRKLVYPWLRFDLLEDRYHTARNRDQIERTEDFALGWQASVLLGYAATGFGSDRNAGIFQLSLAKGHELSPRQTLLWNSAATGRWESGALANAQFSAKAHYYFRQSPRRLFFMTLAADAAHHLDADQQILLGGDNGLRAYPLRYQSGAGRWLFTAEQRWYTNWYPFRLFNVGGAAFYDMGRTFGSGTATSRDQGLLKDIGVGLRLGANRSALGNVVHVDLSYPLDGDASVRKLQIGVETRRSF